MDLSISLDKQSLLVWQAEGLERLRYEYPVKPGDRVLDIGSYQREWGKRFEEQGCQVEYFDALDNRAAWVEDGTIRMGGAYYYTSMFQDGGQEYQCVDIAPFLTEKVAVCKINIEGMEYGLLEYMIGTGLIRNIEHIQVQFHHIEGVDTLAEYGKIRELLTRTHEVSWRYPFVWESWQRI